MEIKPNATPFSFFQNSSDNPTETIPNNPLENKDFLEKTKQVRNGTQISTIDTQQSLRELSKEEHTEKHERASRYKNILDKLSPIRESHLHDAILASMLLF